MLGCVVPDHLQMHVSFYKGSGEGKLLLSRKYALEGLEHWEPPQALLPSLKNARADPGRVMCA